MVIQTMHGGNSVTNKTKLLLIYSCLLSIQVVRLTINKQQHQSTQLTIA